MFTLTIERFDGQRLTLTQRESAYTVKYSGLEPVAASIATSKRAIGVRRNSTHAGARNIVLYVNIYGDVEANRIRLYQFLAPQSIVKLHYSNGARNICVVGCVEAHEVDQFSVPSYAQISIMCESPYLPGAEAIVQEITSTIDKFEFPFAIDAEGVEFSATGAHGYANAYNSGDVPTGAIFRIFAHADVVNPVVYNALSNEYFRVNVTLAHGDTLMINTSIGAKNVTITKMSGETASALFYKADGSTWLQLAVGDNYISYAADSGADSMAVSIEYNNLFIGV